MAAPEEVGVDLTPVPFTRRILPSLAAALAGGIVAVAALHALPFLARLDALAPHPPSPAEWASFVEVFYVLGALAGLTALSPWKLSRPILVLPLVALLGIFLLTSAIDQTLPSLTSGDSLIGLIFASPIFLGIGLAYLLLGAAILFAIMLGASLLVRVAAELPLAAHGAGAAAAAIVSLVVLWPSLTLPAPPPAPAPAAPTPPVVEVPRCHDEPFVDELQHKTGLRAAARRLPDEPKIELYLIAPASDWSDEQVIAVAQQALLGQLQCKEGDKIWSPRFTVAKARPVDLTLRVIPAKHADRHYTEMMLASNLRSTLQGNLAGDHAGRFYSRIGAGAFLPIFDEAVQLVGCSLGCEGGRIAVSEFGEYPTLGTLKVEWARGR